MSESVTAINEPLYLVPRNRTVGVRDAGHSCVAMLRVERCDDETVRLQIIQSLAKSVRQHDTSERYKAMLAEAVGREVCWDAILEEVEELVNERDRMRATIGELRGKLSGSPQNS